MKHPATTLFAAAFAAALLAGCGGNGTDAAADRGDDAPLVAAMMPEVPPYTYLDPATGEPGPSSRAAASSRTRRPAPAPSSRASTPTPPARSSPTTARSCS